MRHSLARWLLTASLLASTQASADPKVRDHRHGHGDHDRDHDDDDRGPRDAPPAPKAENVGNKAGFVWISGNWDWNHGQWVWQAGHWEKNRKAKRWRGHRWEKKGDFYVRV